MREQDKKIAEWMELDASYYAAHLDEIPQYSTSDAAAISLLPALVKKGFTENSLHSRMAEDDTTTMYCFQIHEVDIDGEWKLTIAEAICAAIISLIDSEGKGEKNETAGYLDSRSNSGMGRY